MRATITWGAPALLARLAASLPTAVRAAVAGWEQTAKVSVAPSTVVRGIFEELLDTAQVAKGASVEILRWVGGMCMRACICVCACVCLLPAVAVWACVCV